MILGYYLANRETIKKGLPEDLFMDLMMYIIIFSLLGARLYYVFFNLDYYSYCLILIGGFCVYLFLSGGCRATSFTPRASLNFRRISSFLLTAIQRQHRTYIATMGAAKTPMSINALLNPQQQTADVNTRQHFGLPLRQIQIDDRRGIYYKQSDFR